MIDPMASSTAWETTFSEAISSSPLTCRSLSFSMISAIAGSVFDRYDIWRRVRSDQVILFLGTVVRDDMTHEYPHVGLRDHSHPQVLTDFRDSEELLRNSSRHQSPDGLFLITNLFSLSGDHYY